MNLRLRGPQKQHTNAPKNRKQCCSYLKRQNKWCKHSFIQQVAATFTSIRVPGGTKTGSNVLEFQSPLETRVNDVADALDAIYAETGKPVSARQIGDVVGMKPPQTLVYLHQAKEAGRANPVPTNNPKWTKGWVPGSVDVPNSVLDEGAKSVAATLGKMFKGKPISGSAIARELGQDVRPGRSWLNHAETMGLVAQTETRRGWIPVAS